MKLGAKTIIYTDIATDGTLMGPSLKSTKELISSVNIDIIASGGVSSLSDIMDIKEIGAEGVIVGKAIYEGKVELKEVFESVN
jgi:phosphoribosylformimino-5-aminoimidazole carboxamide ribotide isomerase